MKNCHLKLLHVIILATTAMRAKIVEKKNCQKWLLKNLQKIEINEEELRKIKFRDLIFDNSQTGIDNK